MMSKIGVKIYKRVCNWLNSVSHRLVIVEAGQEYLWNHHSVLSSFVYAQNFQYNQLIIEFSQPLFEDHVPCAQKHWLPYKNDPYILWNIPMILSN